MFIGYSNSDTVMHVSVDLYICWISIQIPHVFNKQILEFL